MILLATPALQNHFYIRYLTNTIRIAGSVSGWTVPPFPGYRWRREFVNVIDKCSCITSLLSISAQLMF